MIQNDATILEHHVQEWKKVIPIWAEEHKHNMTARNILHQREIGDNVSIDVVEKYDKTGPSAQIIAKGGVPETFGIKTSNVPFQVYQIATGFGMHQRDLNASPKLKERMVEIALAEIHEAEDNFTLNGSTPHNVSGIVAAAQANPNGKIVASGASGNDVNNKGKWAHEAGTDIFEDVSTAIGMLDGKFKPAFLVGHSKDIRYLFRKDSERRMYYEDMGILFDKKEPKDVSWIWNTDLLTRGKVYLVTKDTMAADFVISENPNIIAYPMERGQNYPIEVYAWAVPEIYQNTGFVEIAIT